MPTLALRQSLVAITFIFCFIMGARLQVSDPDLYWHLRSGQVMLDTGDVIRGDIFSHTMPGGHRPHHEWLGEIVMVVFYNTLGHHGLTLLAGLFVVAACGLAFWMMRGELSIKLILVVVAALSTTNTAMARPQAWMVVFTLVIMAMVLRRGIGLRWLPLVMIAWGNLHGGWVVGFIVLGAGIFSETVKLALQRGGDVRWLGALVGWSLAGAAGLTINPYGFDQLLVPFDTLTQAARPFLAEWRAPELFSSTYLPFTLLLGLGAAVLIGYRRQIPLVEAVLLIGFGVWAMTSARVIILYVFVAVVIVAPYVSAFIERFAPRLIPTYTFTDPVRVGLPLLPSLTILAIVLALASFSYNAQPDRIAAASRTANLPVAAVEYLRGSGAPRELFNSYTWGGYLIYELPEYPVFIDGRADLYDDFFLVYNNTYAARDGWRETFREYDIQTVLIPPRSRLAEALRVEPGWSVAYEDITAVVFQVGGE
ncbi:MAG: hypothetical protein MUF38_06165 [Anaerolineae bacterium]|nr:hypothetical protein [Anaerolineae bacterium]